MIDLKLPRQQQALYDRLRGGGDVLIDDLCRAVDFPEELLHERDDRSRSQAQNRLGPYVQRLNRRLAQHRLKVVPGALKRSYRLSALE